MFFITFVLVIQSAVAGDSPWITHGQMLISPYTTGYYIVATPKHQTTAEPPLEIIPSIELNLDQMAYASQVEAMTAETIATSLFRPETVNSFQKLFPKFVPQPTPLTRDPPVRIYVDNQGFVKVSKKCL